jgi:hypothetical protein
VALIPTRAYQSGVEANDIRSRAGPDELDFREPRRWAGEQRFPVAAQVVVEVGPQIPALHDNTAMRVDSSDEGYEVGRSEPEDAG